MWGLRTPLPTLCSRQTGYLCPWTNRHTMNVSFQSCNSFRFPVWKYTTISILLLVLIKAFLQDQIVFLLDGPQTLILSFFLVSIWKNNLLCLTLQNKAMHSLTWRFNFLLAIDIFSSKKKKDCSQYDAEKDIVGMFPN